MSPLVAIQPDAENKTRAEQLSGFLNAPLVEQGKIANCPFVLEYRGVDLLLRSTQNAAFKPWKPDFASYYKNRGKDPLIRAIGSKPCSVIDATAGWCMDAAHIVRAGHNVIAVEHNKVVFSLVNHELEKYHGEQLGRNLTLLCMNSIDHLSCLQTRADVIYLDPMYPQKRKTAATRKEMVLLRELSFNNDSDGNIALFRCAINQAKYRVIVKRPQHAAPLAPGKVGEIHGKLVRFDIYHPVSD